MLRRRMMMDTKKDSAKYPLVNGRHVFDAGVYVEVTNRNHVKVDNAYISGLYINFSDINKNTNQANSVANINYLPEWMTLKANSICEWRIKNIKKGMGMVGINFRKANSNTSLGFSDGNFSDNQDITKVVTIAEDVSASCLFIYVANANLQRIEFDVEFTVNGERWI